MIPKHKVCFYADIEKGQNRNVVRDEFLQLTSDKKTRNGTYELMPRLVRVSIGKDPPNIDRDDRYDLICVFQTKNVAAIYVVGDKVLKGIRKVVVLRFCKTASSQIRVTDLNVAERRLQLLGKGRE